jgi:hypothetical protein
MLPAIYQTGLQIELNYHEPVSENLEEYGQKHGTLVIFPTLRDRIALQAGQMLIEMGLKLKASSMQQNGPLSNEMA